MRPIRHALRHAAPFLLALAAAVPLAGHAQAPAPAWPTRALTIVAPFPAGGVADALARSVAQRLSEQLGQPVVVDNRGGAGGSVAAAAAARSAPDGHTLFVGSQGTQATNAVFYKSLPYDPVNDFVPVHAIAGGVNLLVVPPDRPYKTVRELVAYAKAHPGKLNFASAGAGTSTHLTALMFQRAAGIELTHVAYKGSSPALTDLMGGQVDLMFDYPASSGPHVQAGTLRALAVTYGQRVASLPNVPTMAEAGVADVESVAWTGLFAPARTPPAIVARLSAEMEKAIASPEFTQVAAKAGVLPLNIAGPKFTAFVASETVKWQDLARRSGAVPQ
ncbi:Bug family tripartite tricarboxylate transporter substrate binding protein [Hydrogenophaga sp.]|jgi:tripartite-type tricarboxylate transporter receptor subunit TctC|uniref:Bug family tripartite tricarboxylate transporter substrate binding protein n=1 Tax=Hydrogenophaga sp. TaxID=1904254 RepID=UPI003F6EBFDA